MYLPFAMPVESPVLAATESAWVRPYSTTDVFARRERNANSLERPGANRTNVVLDLGNDSIQFSYLGHGTLPGWVRPVFESLSQRWGIGAGWDGHAAVPTKPELVAELLNCLEMVLHADALAPTMTPLADGGMQAEWHNHGKSLEIVVCEGEDPEFYLFDPATGYEEEGSFEGSIPLIRCFLTKF